jgi:hypothetical protein
VSDKCLRKPPAGYVRGYVPESADSPQLPDLEAMSNADGSNRVIGPRADCSGTTRLPRRHRPRNVMSQLIAGRI